MKSVKKLNTEKVNEDGMLLSENLMNGSDLLFVYVSLLLTNVVSHKITEVLLYVVY